MRSSKSGFQYLMIVATYSKFDIKKFRNISLANLTLNDFVERCDREVGYPLKDIIYYQYRCINKKGSLHKQRDKH